MVGQSGSFVGHAEFSTGAARAHRGNDWNRAGSRRRAVDAVGQFVSRTPSEPRRVVSGAHAGFRIASGVFGTFPGVAGTAVALDGSSSGLCLDGAGWRRPLALS